jgi:hypothetical protein
MWAGELLNKELAKRLRTPQSQAHAGKSQHIQTNINL